MTTSKTVLSFAALGITALAWTQHCPADEPSGSRVYENTLTPIKDLKPILADSRCQALAR